MKSKIDKDYQTALEQIDKEDDPYRSSSLEPINNNNEPSADKPYDKRKKSKYLNFLKLVNIKQLKLCLYVNFYRILALVKKLRIPLRLC